MITSFEASEDLLAELEIEAPAADSVLGDAIADRHAREHRVIDIVYNPSREVVQSLVSGAEEAGMVATGPELAPLCEATGCAGCDEHWRTTVYGSTALLDHLEIHADLAAVYAAAGLSLDL